MPRLLSNNGLVALRLKHSDPREVYAGLLWVCIGNGYHLNWVDNKFHGVFGKWPRPQTSVDPQVPTLDLVKWLGTQNSRYRAKMKREEKRNETSQSDRPNPLLVSR